MIFCYPIRTKKKSIKKQYQKGDFLWYLIPVIAFYGILFLLALI